MIRCKTFLALSSIVLTSACSQPADDAGPAQPVAAAAALELTGTSWQVEDIDGGGVVDASNVTLLFPEDGKVVGTSGCNRYFGSVVIAGSTISFGDAGTTMMACPEALMAQERLFFDALGKVTRGEVDAEARLVLYDETGTPRIRATEYVPTDSAPEENQPQPMDAAAEERFSFDCGPAGRADVRFLGPDTVELSLAGETYILPRERAASGAKYSKDEISFWNKGDEALVEVGAERYSCRRN